MDVFEKIEAIFENKSDNEYFQEILKELKEIKNILKFTPSSYTMEYKKNLPKEYFEFVNKFRYKMRKRRDIDPTLEFEGMRLGVNERGLLYNKDSGKILPTYKAFYVYERLFFDKLLDI